MNVQEYMKHLQFNIGPKQKYIDVLVSAISQNLNMYWLSASQNIKKEAVEHLSKYNNSMQL